MFSKLFSRVSTAFFGRKGEEDTTQTSFGQAAISHAYTALSEFGKAVWSFAEAALCGITCVSDMLIKGVSDPEVGPKAAKHLADGIISLSKVAYHTVASLVDSAVVGADMLTAAAETAVPAISSAAISAKDMMFKDSFLDYAEDEDGMIEGEYTNLVLFDTFSTLEDELAMMGAAAEAA